MRMSRLSERFAIVVVIALAFVFIEIKLSEVSAQETKTPVVKLRPPQTPESMPGEYLVRFKPSVGEVTTQNRGTLEDRMRGKILRVYSDLDFAVVRKPVIQNHKSAMMDITGSGEVLLVEPNYVYRTNKSPGDANYNYLWGMKNVGQTAGTAATAVAGIAGIDIDAERGWDVTSDSGSTVVAVIDTGIDYTHPDLRENIWVNAAEAAGVAGVDDDGNGVVDDIHGANFVDPKTASGDPMDDNGHGTHCAGSIGGRGDNHLGVAGVAWRTKMMAVKFLDDRGGGSLENAIRAVDYATRMGARVFSNSWSGGGFSQLLQDAVTRSSTAGALFVAAASNSADNNDTNPAYPATYPVANIVSVAAIDNRGRLAEFSNYGSKTVHIAAPGKEIYSTWKGGTYQFLSGTSMATPHVSGLAALLWNREPHLTALDVKSRLMAGARPLGALRKKTISGGLLNAHYTLNQEIPPQDANDPLHWQRMPMSFSTPHPYGKKAEISFEVYVPGAKEIAVFFDKMEVEAFYDFVYFLDRSGNTITRTSDAFDADFSPTISGDYVKIVLRSDDSVEKYGFDLSGVAYR